jgi:hypothetical protein
MSDVRIVYGKMHVNTHEEKALCVECNLPPMLK